MNSFFEKLFFINKKTKRDNEISDKWLENENLLFSNKMKKRRIVIKNTKKEYCPHCYSQKLKKIYSHFFNGHHNYNEESNQEKSEEQEINNLKIDMSDKKDLYKNTGFFDYVEDKNKILENNDLVKKINYNDIENNQNNKNEINNDDNELKNNQNEEFNIIDNNNIIGGKINDNYNNNIQNNIENNQLKKNELDNNKQNNENEIVHNYINENEKKEENNENNIENNDEIQEKNKYVEMIKNYNNEENNNYQNNNYENDNNNEDKNNNQNNNYEKDNNKMKILKISKLIISSSSSEQNENSINNDYNEKNEYNENYYSNNNQQNNNLNNKIDEIFETVKNPQIIESFSPINKQIQIKQYHYISKDKLDTANFKSSPFSFREKSMDEETVKNFVVETEKKPKLILKVNKYFAPAQKLSICFNKVKNAYKLTKSNQD